jgi:hypothetical protein
VNYLKSVAWQAAFFIYDYKDYKPDSGCLTQVYDNSTAMAVTAMHFNLSMVSDTPAKNTVLNSD